MYFDGRLFGLTKGVRLRILFAAVLGLTAVAAGVARLAISGVIIYRVVTGQAAFSSMLLPVAAIAVLIGVRALFQFWQNAVSHHTANIVKIKLREEVYRHSLELGPGRFDQQRTGDVVLTMVEGIERLETFFGQYLSQIIVSTIAPIAIFVYMASLDLVIALVFLGFAVLTLVVPAMFHNWNRISSFRRRNSYGALASDFLDSVQGLPTLKAFGQGKARGETLAGRAQDLYRATMGVVAANSATSGASILFMTVSAAVALIIGALRVESGAMDLRPLLIVLMLGVEVFRPLRELTNLYHAGMTVMASSQSVFGLLDAKPDVLDPAKPAVVVSNGKVDIEPEIEFHNVTFGYRGGHRPAIQNVSFKLGNGQTLGIAGPSGAGKSTLVWLMYRFYDPQQGSITLGGHDLRELPLEVIRSQIAVVTQDTYLFHGTVVENLLFGKPDATREEIEAAARAANAHDFIMALPQGYDTVVGERAVRLSGGQRQRIAIARALLKNAPILILDEALSSVDAENESLIQQALDRLKKGRTTFVIAHRLSSIVNADRILVFQDGEIREEGTHRDLIAMGGVYAELMRHQVQESPADAIPVGKDHTASAASSTNGKARINGSAVLTEDDSRKTPAPLSPAAVDARSLSVWLRLLGLVRPVMGQFVATVLLGVLNHGAVVAIGAASALLVGGVIRGEPLDTYLIAVAVLAPLAGLLFYLESWQAHDMAFRLLASMRIDLYNKLEPLAPAYMIRRRSGDVVSIVGGDVETVEYFFAHAVSPMIVALVVPGAVLAILAFIAWPLALILSPFLLAVAVSPFFANKRNERLGQEVRGRMGDISAFMVDNIQGMREISAFRRGVDRTAEMTRKGWEYAAHLVRFQKSQAFQVGFIESMMGIGGLAVLTAGVWLITSGQMERAMLPLVSVIALAAFNPVAELARTMKQLLETLAASRRIMAISDEPVPVLDGPGVVVDKSKDIALPLTFDHVTFAYGPGEPQALSGVSFELYAGQTLALVGRSGAGKTTTAHLLMRFWDPDTGVIRLGDKDIRMYKLDDLRNHVSLVSQDTYLFNDTIRENIRLGRQRATDADVEWAAKEANAHDFVTSFPDGYDTPVGERGMQLSGGQRQRIAIARAILKNAPMLILDEATSHLDAINESLVRTALDRLVEGRTTLVIAHRLSTIMNADRIIVLDDGRLVEQGTHRELLAKGGLYAQLVQTQMVGISASMHEGMTAEGRSSGRLATEPADD